MNKDWLKELANDKSLYEMAKERINLIVIGFITGENVSLKSNPCC
jgi:hypothetical protein